MLEKLIANWRARLPAEAADELEDHLRESIARFQASGMGELEAFGAAVKTAGSPAQIAEEFAKMESNSWWAVRLNLGLAAVIAFLTVGFLAAQAQAGKWSLLLAGHIFAVTLGYSGIFLTGGLGIAYVLQRAFVNFPRRRLGYAAKTARAFAAASLLCAAAGVLLGMMWTNGAWGRYWDWDPKETSAFTVLVWLMAYLLISSRVSPRVTLILSIVGNFIVAYAWFGPPGSNSFLLLALMLFFHIAVLCVASMRPASLARVK